MKRVVQGGSGDSESEDTDWLTAPLEQALAQRPAALTDAVKKGYAPKLWTVAEGWESDCHMCTSRGTAMECSFCNHVYHNTMECIGQLGADNIASAASIAHGAHWACPGCWKETRTAARRALLGTAPKAKKQRRARRTNAGTGSKQK